MGLLDNVKKMADEAKKKADLNGDGKVDKADLEVAKKKVDQNGDGKFDKTDLDAVKKKLGKK